MFIIVFTECFLYAKPESSGPLRLKLLSLLNLWELTLAQNNPYKEDFSNIHKKHSTLSTKGK